METTPDEAIAQYLQQLAMAVHLLSYAGPEHIARCHAYPEGIERLADVAGRLLAARRQAMPPPAHPAGVIAVPSQDAWQPSPSTAPPASSPAPPASSPSPIPPTQPSSPQPSSTAQPSAAAASSAARPTQSEPEPCPEAGTCGRTGGYDTDPPPVWDTVSPCCIRCPAPGCLRTCGRTNRPGHSRPRSSHFCEPCKDQLRRRRR